MGNFDFSILTNIPKKSYKKIIDKNSFYKQIIRIDLAVIAVSLELYLPSFIACFMTWRIQHFLRHRWFKSCSVLHALIIVRISNRQHLKRKRRRPNLILQVLKLIQQLLKLLLASGWNGGHLIQWLNCYNGLHSLLSFNYSLKNSRGARICAKHYTLQRW